MDSRYAKVLVLLSGSLILSGNKLKDNFDRLDGRGSSGCKVDAIEWKNNLEVHSYPPRCLEKISFKVEETEEKKRVLIIAYYFKKSPKKQIIRRAVLGIPIQVGFKVYEDLSAAKDKRDPYDKFIVTNGTIKGSPNVVVTKRLGEPPKWRYPEGHPKRKGNEDPSKVPKKKLSGIY